MALARQDELTGGQKTMTVGRVAAWTNCFSVNYNTVENINMPLKLFENIKLHM